MVPRRKKVRVKIEPLADRVLVRRTKGAEKTMGGILIPESAREKMGEGEVVAVGPGRVRPPLFVDVSDLRPEDAVTILATVRESLGTAPIPLTVKVGQTVLFAVSAGTPLEINRLDHVLLREEDILGIVTEREDHETVGVPDPPVDEGE